MDVATLRESTAAGARPRLIDARTPGECATGHIEGSYHVPLDLLREHRTELRYHLDEHAVLIGRPGNRAAQAEQALGTAGLPDLRLLADRLTAWEAACAPVRRAGPRWGLERQVRLVLAAVLVGVVLPPATSLAALTDTCLMKLPCNRGSRTTVDDVVTALAGDRG
jgi:rhodanese-related sulfurtransferase